MRKRRKRKQRSCALCKPHKMGMDNRWKAKDEAALKEFEQAAVHVLGKNAALYRRLA